MHVQLRPYQEEAVTAVLDAYRHGRRRVAIQVPTGGGKTIIFSRLIEDVVHAGGRALVLAHTEELIDQATQTLRFALPGVDVGLVQATRNDVTAQVAVGTVQSVRSPKRLAALGHFKLVVVDEAHHSIAATYRGILDHFGAFADGRRFPFVLGCSATLDRGDGLALAPIFEEIAYEIDMLSLIEQGYLVDIRAKRVFLDLNLDRVKTKGGDFVDGELGAAMEDAGAPADIAAGIAKYAADRRSVVFVPTVRMAQQTAAAISALGIPAAAVSGETPKEERRQLIAAIRAGELRAVCNAMVLTEGFDAPVLDCVVAARPTASRALYQQQVGRGLRPSPGKADCLLLDMTGVTGRHSLVHTGSLFGLEADELAEDETVTEAVARKQQAEAEQERKAGRLVAINVNLFQRSRLNWLRSPGGVIVLTGMRDQFAIRPDADGAIGDLFRLVPDGYGQRAELVETGITIELAQGIAEASARQSGYDPLAAKQSGWRSDPVTDAQKRQLWHLRPTGWHSVQTKGDASNLIAGAKADQALALLAVVREELAS